MPKSIDATARKFVKALPHETMIDALPGTLKALVERYRSEGNTNLVRGGIDRVRAGLDELALDLHHAPRR